MIHRLLACFAVASLPLPAMAAQVNTPFTFADVTSEPSSGFSDGGGTRIGYGFSTSDVSPTVFAAAADVTDFTPGLDFSVSGNVTVDTLTDRGNGSFALVGFTLFGDTLPITGNSQGLFTSLNLFEEIGGYDAGQRLFVGTNMPNTTSNYLGNIEGNGGGLKGGTFLLPSGTQNLAEGTPNTTYSFDVEVSYDTANQIDVSYTVSDGTNSNTLAFDDVDISAISGNSVFGFNGFTRREGITGTFSNFTVNQVIPEPASLALLGLGGTCLLGRRRRRA